MTKLDCFRLSKVQMNCVHGGQNYNCHVSNVDVGGTISKDFIVSASSAEKAEIALRQRFSDCYVDCF